MGENGRKKKEMRRWAERGQRKGRRAEKSNCQEQKGGLWVMERYRISVLQDEKDPVVGRWSHNNVNALNTIGLHP